MSDHSERDGRRDHQPPSVDKPGSSPQGCPQNPQGYQQGRDGGESPQGSGLEVESAQLFTFPTPPITTTSKAKALSLKAFNHFDSQDLKQSHGGVGGPGGEGLLLSGWKVDRVAVTETEADLAQAVLSEWNDQTGQALRSKDWLAKIVMRIREYPEFTITEHSHVIAAALRDPWWKGPPSPSVVYGNGAQFERSITVTADPGERIVTAEETLALAKRLREAEGQ